MTDDIGADSPIWTERRDHILLAALPNVAFDGWTQALLVDAARSAGYAPEVALLEFPAGPADLVAHFSDWADRQMLVRLEGADLSALKVRARITLGVRVRLEVVEPYREAVCSGLSLLAMPQHTVRATRLLWRSCDAIWWAAGDTATDFNHYSKRGLLSGVLAATTLHWLNDSSDEHAESWAFLDRRIANALSIGGLAGRLAKAAPDCSGLLRHLPSPKLFKQAWARK
jgi:ubiquinone biosynthesis protein COQ9